MKKESCVWNLVFSYQLQPLVWYLFPVFHTTFVGAWAKPHRCQQRCDQRLDWQDRRGPDSGTLCSCTIRTETTHEEGSSLNPRYKWGWTELITWWVKFFNDAFWEFNASMTSVVEDYLTYHVFCWAQHLRKYCRRPRAPWQWSQTWQ